jgi:hypothetical protein
MSAGGNLIRVRFRVYAATDPEGYAAMDPEGRSSLEYVEAVSNRTATLDQAKAIAAQFPKSVGLRVHRFIGRRGANATGEVVFHAALHLNKSKHGVNEGGVKRYRSFCRHARRLSHEVHYDPGDFQGSFDVVPSEEEFEQRLRGRSTVSPSRSSSDSVVPCSVL